jgi:hypothetical protein
MNFIPRPVASLGASDVEGHLPYDIVDEDSNLTVLHIEPRDEAYRASWHTRFNVDDFTTYLCELDLSPEEDLTANFNTRERSGENSLTADVDTVLTQDLYDWQDCSSMTLDMGAFELSWIKQDDANEMVYWSHDGSIKPLGTFYNNIPYAHYEQILDGFTDEELNQFYESFAKQVFSSAEEIWSR